VWLAWGSREDIATRRLLIPGDRRLFQDLVAALGIDLVRRKVLGLPPLPDYIRRQAI
jgi:nicotinamide-nucleotide amidase